MNVVTVVDKIYWLFVLYTVTVNSSSVIYKFKSLKSTVVYPISFTVTLLTLI